MTYQIIPYSHDHAAALATMWNESDDQWPGTFTHGVPMTEKRIVDWMSSFDPLLNLIIVQQNGVQDGDTVVGYGSLQDTANQSGISCYVPLLNVHPAHQGRSLCRKMLQQMVEYAAEKEYRRMTLGTWSGNLQSIPLYKKVGFFWKPDLDVGMENYHPLLMTLPATQAFFAKADWYRDFKRPLNHLPDAQTHPLTGDTPVYRLCWEKGGETVEAIIDRHAQGLTGLETADFAVYATVAESEPAQGIRYPVHWHLHNKRNEPLAVKLQANGDEGINVAYENSLTLAPQEKQTLSSTYLCLPNADPLDFDNQWGVKPRPSIQTTLQLGATSLQLSTGLAYRPAVEISLDNALSQTLPTLMTALVPGKPQTFLVQLHNHQKRPFSGTLHLHKSDQLQADWQTHPFSVAANGWAAVPLTLCQTAGGGSTVAITARFEDAGQQVEAKTAETAVLCLPLGGVAATAVNVGSDKEQLHVANEFYHVTVNKEGGVAHVWLKGGHSPQVQLRQELGPPHEPNDLGEQISEMRLETAVGQAKVTLVLNSTRFPGLQLTRELIFTASPLIEVRQQLKNIGEQEHDCYIQTVTHTLDLDFDNAQVYVPRRERLVTALATNFLRNDNDMPKEPTGMAEEWIALDVGGQIHGVIWSEETTKHEVFWFRVKLQTPRRRLARDETVVFQPNYLFMGAGTWQTVQRAWQRLAGATAPAYQRVGQAHEVGFASADLLTASDSFSADLTLDNVSSLALNGRLSLAPPAHWQTGFAAAAFTDIMAGKPFSTPVPFTAQNDDIGPATGSIQLETAVSNTTHPFTIIRLGSEQQAVSVTEGVGQDGGPLWSMENGRCQWQLAPNYHGGLIAWHDENDVNHLHSLYPQTDGTFETFKPWFGGVQPILRRHVDDWDSWPGKFYSESFTAQATSHEHNGLLWRGLRVSTTPTGQGFEGLRAEVDYLTLGQSNVLKLMFTVVNESTVWRTAVPALHTYLQVGGTLANSTLHSDGQQRKRTKHEHWGWYGPWSAVENPETGDVVGLISASGLRRTHWLDWGIWGSHLYVEDTMKLAPHSQQSLVAYLVLTKSVADTAQYVLLAQ
ncbi:MAG: GNAT family N-acetyltransferase [Chloroflexota bacterium]